MGPVYKLWSLLFAFDNNLHPSIMIWPNRLGGSVEYTDCRDSDGLDSHSECPGYDTKQSDGEVSVILEFWRMRNIHSLLSPPRSTLAGSGSYLWIK